MPEENFEEMSEDLQKIFDDDSKCARLLKKILREDRSFELRLQRLQEFQNYLEKSDSNKVRALVDVLRLDFSCRVVHHETGSTCPEPTLRTVPRSVRKRLGEEFNAFVLQV